MKLRRYSALLPGPHENQPAEMRSLMNETRACSSTERNHCGSHGFGFNPIGVLPFQTRPVACLVKVGFPILNRIARSPPFRSSSLCPSCTIVDDMS